MRRRRRWGALLLAGLTTAGVATWGAVEGLLEPFERRTLDVRLKTSPPSDAMDSDIAHVDIDDASLDRYGPWPWPRALLADATKELTEAGARTIAYDLLLVDAQPKSPIHARGQTLRDGSLVDHDRELADAFGALPTILGVSGEKPSWQSEIWSVGEGAAALERVLRVIRKNPAALAGEIATAAKLDTPRARSLKSHLGSIRRLAIQQLIAEHRPASLDQLVDRAEFENLPVEALRPVFERSWNEAIDWQTIAPLHTGGSVQIGVGQSPVAILGEAANAIGHVDFAPDSDGTVRSIEPFVTTPSGRVPQLGLMAAAVHLGIPVDEIERDDQSLRVGDRTLPMRADHLWICWPRSGGGWDEIRSTDGQTIAHLSLGYAVDLAQARRAEQHNLERLTRRTRELAEDLLGLEIETVDDDAIRTVREETAFLRESLDDIVADGETWTEEEQQFDLTLREWTSLADEVERASRELPARRARLREQIEGKLVFIGWAATGSAADFVDTAIAPMTPGVVVHAAVADQIIAGRGLRWLPAALDLTIIVLAGLLSTLLATILPPLRATAAIGTLLGGYTAVAWAWVFPQQQVVLPIIGPALTGGLAWMTITALAASMALRDRRRVTRQFRARVGPELVDFLLRNPQELSHVGHQREITVLFADLAGFTRISEALGPEQTVPLLNRCMRELTTRLTAHGAYVNKFLGDGLLAFWSAFREDPDQRESACRAALECLHALDEVNAESKARGLPELKVRIGIATGNLIVGDCGAPPHLHDYTVIGDAANLASRLESANKQFGTSILLDGTTREGVESPVFLRPLGRITVVNQTRPVEVFELLAEQIPEGLMKQTQHALTAFAEGDLETSRAVWGKLLEDHEDPVAQLYLNTIDQDPTRSDGVLELREK